MYLFRISFLLLSSYFLLTACTPKALGKLTKSETQTADSTALKSFFHDDFKAFVFKANMTFGKDRKKKKARRFGGLMVVKQLEPETYRVVFMAEVGLTIFDFEFGKNGFIVHRAFEQLNRKIILKLIENDIGLLLMRGPFDQKITTFEADSGELTVQRTKVGGKAHYYARNKEGQLVQIHQGTQVGVELSKHKEDVPKKILIKHNLLPLELKLRLIKH